VRIDSSEHFLGLRLNMYIAIALTLAGLVWFVLAQRRPDRPVVIRPAKADGPAQPAAETLPPPDGAAEGPAEAEGAAEGVATARSEEL